MQKLPLTIVLPVVFLDCPVEIPDLCQERDRPERWILLVCDVTEGGIHAATSLQIANVSCGHIGYCGQQADMVTVRDQFSRNSICRHVAPLCCASFPLLCHSL